jgi:hypothetical protein
MNSSRRRATATTFAMVHLLFGFLRMESAFNLVDASCEYVDQHALVSKRDPVTGNVVTVALTLKTNELKKTAVLSLTAHIVKLLEVLWRQYCAKLHLGPTANATDFRAARARVLADPRNEFLRDVRDAVLSCKKSADAKCSERRTCST